MSEQTNSRIVLWGPAGDDFGELKTSLEREGLHIESLESEDEVRGVVKRGEADLVVARLYCGFESALDLLEWMKGLPAPPPVIIVTEGRNIRLYLEAMQRGAFDCVGLPVDEQELRRIVAQALETRFQTEAAPGGRR